MCGLHCIDAVPEKLQLVQAEDGSVTWLATGMLTAEESISAEQLGLDSIDVQVQVVHSLVISVILCMILRTCGSSLDFCWQQKCLLDCF